MTRLHNQPVMNDTTLLSGEAIESLCEKTLDDSIAERGAIARAARCLLSSVTRVLILADVVVVKQLIFSKDKVSCLCFFQSSNPKLTVLIKLYTLYVSFSSLISQMKILLVSFRRCGSFKSLGIIEKPLPTNRDPLLKINSWNSSVILN